MAGSTLSIKLRCTSWQQLATIYRRDLSRGSMFLKAANQPPLGTQVKIDLELPSATVLELNGIIAQHVVDPQRGTGVELKLEALPTKTVWLIESALAAENKVRTQTGAVATPDSGRAATNNDAPGDSATAIAEGENVAAAEQELNRALEAEAESLRKLNPFLVLGVGYETTDADVRAAFGELTKRYHPDRFARYQSTKLRQIAAEIFILIRDAYRKLADQASRQQVRATIGGQRAVAPAQSTRRALPGEPASPSGNAMSSARSIPTPPIGIPSRIVTQQIAKVAVPPPRADRSDRAEVTPVPGPLPIQPPTHPPPSVPLDQATKPGHYDAPTNQSSQSAAIASTQLARPSEPPAHLVERKQSARMPAITALMAPSEVPPAVEATPRRHTTSPVAEISDTSAQDQLIDDGKLEEALASYRALAKKNPQDRAARGGIELVEGLKASAARDRLEAAQRFEAALELDPSNERAARELADMRRHATNERKGLLSRLMGKKESPS
jgi:tetratricopeptide (TPR) repeat protein